MGKNILNRFLKNYSLKVISDITGINSSILDKYRKNEIQEYITYINKHIPIPSRCVLQKQIKNRMRIYEIIKHSELLELTNYSLAELIIYLEKNDFLNDTSAKNLKSLIGRLNEKRS